jgi:DNA helicase-2/ATP-dependent DNA helicase PcrA
MLFGSVQYNPPSRFIGEIPEEHLRTEGVGSAGFGTSAPGRGRGDRGGSVQWARERGGVPASEGRVFGSGRPAQRAVNESPTLISGDIVEHKVFGRGVVQAIEGDRVAVTFAEGGTKKLLLGYAPIRKIET